MKNLLLLIAVSIFEFTANAQDSSTSDYGIKFGIKTGLNFATVVGGHSTGVEARTAFHLGAVAEIFIFEKFYVQPEILYSAQGFKSSSDEFESKEMYDYLNIPMLAKYYVAQGLSLEAGPQIGFLLSAKYEFKSGGYSESGDVQDVKGVDFGVNLGLGYKLDSGLNFGVRYYLGLYNIIDQDEAPVTDFNNEVFQFSIGYMFK